MFKNLRAVETKTLNHSGRSLVGETLQLEGDLRTSGSLDIAGLINGNVYVSDYNNNRVQKFTSNGLFAVTWGTAGTGDGQFSATLGNVAVAPDGSVYVVDGGISRIQKFSEVP